MDSRTSAAFAIAIGKPVKRKDGRYTPQMYYSKGDHYQIASNEDLYSLITAHGVELPEAANDDQIKHVKSQLPFIIPGGLISGGSENPIPEGSENKAHEIHTRRNGKIGANGIACFDVDDLSEAGFQALTGGAVALFGGTPGTLAKYHGLAYETISSKEGARRLRLCLFLTEAVPVEKKAIVYAQLEQKLMQEIGATRCEITETKPSGKVISKPGWELYGEHIAFDTTAQRETQVMYAPPCNAGWPIWMFDGARIDASQLPELDKNAMVLARSVPNTGQWTPPTGNIGELAQYLLDHGLAEWQSATKLNVVCAWEDDHNGDYPPGQITSSTCLMLDAKENRVRFVCLHGGCECSGKWDQPAHQAQFARDLGVPEDIIERTFGASSIIHEFECMPQPVIPLEEEQPEEPEENYEDAPDLSLPLATKEPARDVLGKTFNLVDGWRDIDLTSPPGITGKLVEAIDSTSHRELKPAAVAAAFQILATAAGIGRRKSLKGNKINLITLTVAETASGKESSISFFKQMFQAIQHGKHVTAAPRTDKDMILNAITCDAVNAYIIDEAHGFMTALSDPKSSEYRKALGALMLEMATSELLPLAGTHYRELLSELDKKRRELQKATNALDKAKKEEEAAAKAAAKVAAKSDTKQDAKADAKSDTDSDAKQDTEGVEAIDPEGFEAICDAALYIESLTAEINLLQRILQNGISCPVANFAMSSTPAKFDAIISNEDIASGLLGRSTVFRCPEGRERLRRNVKRFDPHAPEFSYLVDIIAGIANKNREFAGYSVTPEAAEMLTRVYNFFEADAQRNKPIIGGLYARGNERIEMFCALQAMDSRVITEAMVIFGFSLFMNSAEDTFAIARENSQKDPLLKLQLAVIDKLKKGKTAKSTLKRTITRKAIFAELEQNAKLRGLESPFEKAVKVLLDNARIKENGKSFELCR